MRKLPATLLVTFAALPAVAEEANGRVETPMRPAG